MLTGLNPAIVVSTHDLGPASRAAGRMRPIDPEGAPHTGTPEELTLREVTGAVPGGGGPPFDTASGVFTLPAAPRTVCDAMADVSAISGYFRLDVGTGDDLAESGWRPFTDLFAGPEPLRRRIVDVAGRLDTGETRVAASILFQGLAARLWSPVVGAAVAHDLLVGLDAARLHWRPATGGPLPLRAAHLTGRHVLDPGRVAEPLYRNVVVELLEPLARAVGGIVRIAPGLLWGNAASALAGAVRAVALERPGLAGRAVALGRELLATGVLRDTGELAEPAPGQPFFVRRGCCLYYRLPGGGKCGDCALITPEARREQWAAALRRIEGA